MTAIRAELTRAGAADEVASGSHKPAIRGTDSIEGVSEPGPFDDVLTGRISELLSSSMRGGRYSLIDAMGLVAPPHVSPLRATKAAARARERKQRVWARVVTNELMLGVRAWETFAAALTLKPMQPLEALAAVKKKHHPPTLENSGLQSVLIALSQIDRVHYRHRLASLREQDRGTSLYEALSRESRLCVITWLDLLIEMEKQPTVQAIRGWGTRHILEGGPLVVNNVVGRVSEINKFKKDLVTHSGLGPSEVENLCDDLRDPLHFAAAASSPSARALALGGRPMWGTFSPTAGELPFEYTLDARNRARKVRATLGLEPRGTRPASDHRLVLLAYNLGAQTAHYPTCADAGKYEPWNYYFSPAEPGEPHGWTKPWDSTDPRLRGRPELVHEPTTVSQIVHPIEIV